MTELQDLSRYQMFIDGVWTDAASGETFESYNPYTARPWALIPRGGAAGRASRRPKRIVTT